MDATIDRTRKSEKLTSEEQKQLRKWVAAQATKVDAAMLLAVTRATLDRVLLSGSGSPETISKIKTAIAA